jgi:hypothetical protein
MRSASEEWAAGTVAIATIDCDSLMKFGTHLHFGTSVLPTNVSIRFTNITGYVTHNVTAASQTGSRNGACTLHVCFVYGSFSDAVGRITSEY